VASAWTRAVNWCGRKKNQRERPTGNKKVRSAGVRNSHVDCCRYLLVDVLSQVDCCSYLIVDMSALEFISLDTLSERESQSMKTTPP
jgi:hypothetical protein